MWGNYVLPALQKGKFNLSVRPGEPINSVYTGPQFFGQSTSELFAAGNIHIRGTRVTNAITAVFKPKIKSAARAAAKRERTDNSNLGTRPSSLKAPTLTRVLKLLNCVNLL